MKSISGIYLAAGNSRRMGSNKLALPLQDTLLGNLALKQAFDSKLDTISVVVPKTGLPEWFDRSFLQEENKRIVVAACEWEEEGQAYSLRTGLKSARSVDPEAIVVLLADQPFVTSNLINDLIDAYQKQPYPFIAASFGDLPRPPILFSKEMFPELAQLKGDEGARKLLRGSWKDKGLIIPYQDKRLFFDIDTACDYHLAKGGL
ncbi:NTP transferase domain-containing protein [Pullulanibacillus sp. KACC 23026]|uniref:NTP transferase domain-containing protein n=1 Tax=Pullulanibacillus sp. KACC 23026 TaxID=3028315 RepID=UPI0023B0E640|nr:NTP transferase domain-containing protein [Pullulanibacillus sp. KACC 23026]WEG14806.1 NTP transferase domain-containing protein [Pullulanibacillus sp. KACC 23026]